MLPSVRCMTLRSLPRTSAASGGLLQLEVPAGVLAGREEGDRLGRARTFVGL